MRRVLKWIGIFLGSVIVLIVLAALAFSAIGYRKLTDSSPYRVTESFTAPASADAVARGQYLVNSTTGCFGCHGDGGMGKMFAQGLPFGTLAAPNLTSGQGGIGSLMTDADWNRAIRHGIGHDGRVLMIMPAEQFTHLSDADLGAIVAYLKSLPPANNVLPARNLAFPAYLLVGTGLFPLPAQSIDQGATHAAAVPQAQTADYGHYIVQLASCQQCHGENLTGLPPNNGNGPPAGPNISPSGEVGAWTQAQFINTIRTGVTPSGHQLSSDMPWDTFKNMTDQDLGAVYLYLHSLPSQ